MITDQEKNTLAAFIALGYAKNVNEKIKQYKIIYKNLYESPNNEVSNLNLSNFGIQFLHDIDNFYTNEIGTEIFKIIQIVYVKVVINILKTKVRTSFIIIIKTLLEKFAENNCQFYKEIEDDEFLECFINLFVSPKRSMKEQVSAAKEGVYAVALRSFKQNDKDIDPKILELLIKILKLQTPSEQNALPADTLEFWFTYMLPLLVHDDLNIQKLAITAFDEFVRFLRFVKYRSLVSDWNKIKKSISEE